MNTKNKLDPYTEDRPTKPGTYFAYDLGESKVIPVVVEWGIDDYGEPSEREGLEVWAPYDECQCSWDQFACWFGPVYVPPLPKGFDPEQYRKEEL